LRIIKWTKNHIGKVNEEKVFLFRLFKLKNAVMVDFNKQE